MPAHLDTARSYVGTVEPNGQNEGPKVVREALSSVGLGPGYPYCAAFVSWCLDKGDAERPDIRTALATSFLDAQRNVEAKQVRRGAVTLRKGGIIVWREGSSKFGHTGFVYHDDLAPSQGWVNQCAYTVEANTTPSDSGNQREGQGIWTRHRCILPTSYFRIVGFVPTSH